MKRLNFPLSSGELTAVILCTIVGSVFFGFFCYLSLNFLSLGNTLPSIVWSAVLALFLCIPVFVAICLKKTSRPTKSRIIWEWALLVLFVVAAVVAALPFSHFFVVSEQKGGIQQTVTANITQAENLFDDYETYANNRLNIYENKLKSITAAISVNPSEYSNYGFVSGTDDKTQVENKMFTLRAQLYPSNYDNMKQVNTKWLADSKAIVTDWKPIGIVTVINEVESELTLWKDQLKGFSSFRAQGEQASDFEYTLTFSTVTNKITEFDSPTSLSILVAIGLYVFILLPYIPIKRHSKFSGYKTLFCSNTSGGATPTSGGRITFN
jgi:hypothetical protein